MPENIQTLRASAPDIEESIELDTLESLTSLTLTEWSDDAISMDDILQLTQLRRLVPLSDQYGKSVEEGCDLSDAWLRPCGDGGPRNTSS